MMPFVGITIVPNHERLEERFLIQPLKPDIMESDQVFRIDRMIEQEVFCWWTKRGRERANEGQSCQLDPSPTWGPWHLSDLP